MIDVLTNEAGSAQKLKGQRAHISRMSSVYKESAIYKVYTGHRW